MFIEVGHFSQWFFVAIDSMSDIVAHKEIFGLKFDDSEHVGFREVFHIVLALLIIFLVTTAPL